MNPIYTVISAVAGIASATVAVWHGSIDGGTYAAIVVGALGIGGISHISSTSKSASADTTNG